MRLRHSRSRDRLPERAGRVLEPPVLPPLPAERTLTVFDRDGQGWPRVAARLVPLEIVRK